jgi:SAM-dependent methyltransferase
MTRWVFERASRLCVSLSEVLLYAAAGLTPLNDLREGVKQHWAPFELRDEYATRLFPWELPVADRFIHQGERVLIVGCGSGRDALPLLERGCIVTGVDPAEQALVRGRQRLAELGYSPTLDCAFFEDWNGDAVFDVCWFSWFAYGYIPDSRRRIEVLRKATRHLAPGGRVVLSYVSGRVISRAATVGRHIGNMRRWREWRLEEGDLVFRVPGTRVLTFEHRFTPEEIEAEARAAGLQPVYSADPIVVLTTNT